MTFFKLLTHLSMLTLWSMMALTARADFGSLFDNQNDQFLPVEKAYQAILTLEEEQLIVDWVIEPGYYLYRDKFKTQQVTPERLRDLPAKYETGQIQYDEFFDKDLEIFYQRTRVKIPLAELPQKFKLHLESQGCADAGLCYPPRSQYFEIDRQLGVAVETEASDRPSGGLGIGGPSSGPASLNVELTLTSVLFYLALAMGGGLILNLMPCVFPVLSLKALSFASTSSSQHNHHLHGWAYTAGVIGSFMAFALLILGARAAGQSAGWGFQLQSPAFVAAMTYLFLVIGLSLSGMVHFGTSLMGVGQGLTANSGLRGSFFTGVLAAVVASPCTGPMMAPALGFALTQPSPIALAIFISLGFGMALPFLLLSYSPSLARLLPRPGPWMEKLKEFLAFPMYLTAAWLLFVFGRQVGMVGVFFLAVGAVAIGLAIWLLQNQPQQRNWRKVVQATALGALVFAGYVVYNGENFRAVESEWQPYSRQLVQQMRNQGRPVFVDFTADWCITCKANEAVALSRQGFLNTVQEHNVALLKGDWTNEDPAITAVLKEFNRSGVPLYLVYPADQSRPPEVLPQLLTQSMVIKALQRAVDPQ